MLTNIHNTMKITANFLGGSDYFVSKQASKQASKHIIIGTREEYSRAYPYHSLSVWKE